MQQREGRAEAVREFNRYYTRRIGVLGDAHLGSTFSLTEGRVLYELAHREQPTAAEIADALSLDRGYLSRTLRSFKRRGLISTKTSTLDRRETLLSLTAAGRRAFEPLDRGAREMIVGLLEPLGDVKQQRLLDAMRDIRRTLGDDHPARDGDCRLRARLHASVAPPGRHGLGRPTTRRHLLGGVRLG